MRFIDLPNDILLRILRLVQVHDILALERTCTTLRETAASRHLWLVQFQFLHQSCTPDLPQYAHIEQLPYAEVRSAVIRAVRWHDTCKKGMVASSKTRKSSVKMETQENFSIPKLEGWSVRLSPGGKLLVINHQGYSAIDVQTGRCICKWDRLSRVPPAAQRFYLEAPSEYCLLIIRGFVNFQTKKIMFDLHQLDYAPRARAQVKKIAQAEYPVTRAPISSHVVDVALGNGFVVASIQINKVYSLLLWNWRSKKLVEVILDTGFWPGHFHILDGRLFFSMSRKTEENRQIRLATIALQEISLLRSSVAHLTDFKTSYAILDPPNGIRQQHGILNLALCDFPSNFGSSTVVQLCVVVAVERQFTRRISIMAYRFAFDLQGPEDDNASSPIHLVHQSTPTPCDSAAFEEFPIWVEGMGRRSGKLVVLAAEKADSIIGPIRPNILHPSRDCFIVGVGDRNEIFFAPISQEPCEGHSRVFMDDQGGGLVRLVTRRHNTYIDVHYVS